MIFFLFYVWGGKGGNRQTHVCFVFLIFHDLGSKIGPKNDRKSFLGAILAQDSPEHRFYTMSHRFRVSFWSSKVWHIALLFDQKFDLVSCRGVQGCPRRQVLPNKYVLFLAPRMCAFSFKPKLFLCTKRMPFGK